MARTRRNRIQVAFSFERTLSYTDELPSTPSWRARASTLGLRTSLLKRLKPQKIGRVLPRPLQGRLLNEAQRRRADLHMRGKLHQQRRSSQSHATQSRWRKQEDKKMYR